MYVGQDKLEEVEVGLGRKSPPASGTCDTERLFQRGDYAAFIFSSGGAAVPPCGGVGGEAGRGAPACGTGP